MPTNIPLADLPNSDFMHDKIASIRQALALCPVPASFEPFDGTELFSFEAVSEDLIRTLTFEAPPKSHSLGPVPTAQHS